MNQYDFVAIGDLTIDAFIRLKDARVNCNINDEECTISMRFGDKIPFEFDEIVAGVGNSPNAAAAASKLGVKAALVANVGKDERGEACITAVREAGVATDFIKTHEGIDTNYHYVLWYEDDRTILIKHHEYPCALPQFEIPPKWVYLSSLSHNTLEYHHEIERYLEANPGVNLAFQPGTFQMELGTEVLKEMYARTTIFFCNKEEAGRILNNHDLDIRDLLSKLHALGPKLVVITDGPKGATASDGENVWFMPAYPDPKPPYERTGAGDAFASTVTAALVLGKTLEEALTWGPINSMSVVQQVGAQKGQLHRDQLEDYLAKASSSYKVEKL